MTGQHSADRDPAPAETPSTARPVLVPLSEAPPAAPGDVQLFDGPGRAPSLQGEPTLVLPPVRLAPGGRRADRRGRGSRRPVVVAGAMAAMAVLGTGAALLERSGGDGHRVATPVPSGAAVGTRSAAASAPPSSSPSSARSGTAAASAPAAPTSARPARSSPAAPAPARPSASAAAPSATASSTGPRTLSLGDTGPDVTDLQTRLREIHLEHRKPTGTYDSLTQNDVARFQSQYGITGDPSGVYGPATRAQLLSLTGG